MIRPRVPCTYFIHTGLCDVRRYLFCYVYDTLYILVLYLWPFMSLDVGNSGLHSPNHNHKMFRFVTRYRIRPSGLFRIHLTIRSCKSNIKACNRNKFIVHQTKESSHQMMSMPGPGQRNWAPDTRACVWACDHVPRRGFIKKMIKIDLRVIKR